MTSKVSIILLPVVGWSIYNILQQLLVSYLWKDRRFEDGHLRTTDVLEWSMLLRSAITANIVQMFSVKAPAEHLSLSAHHHHGQLLDYYQLPDTYK